MFELEDGEKIVKVLRRHFFVMVPHLLFVIFAALAPLIIHRVVLSGFFPFDPKVNSAVQNLVGEWGFFYYSLWLLLLWVIFFIDWTNYYLDLWVITDRRIMDVEQKSFFYRQVTSFRYLQIQDITVDTKGVIPTLLKFGTLHVETAGERRNIIIRDAHYPEEARLLILKLQEKERERVGGISHL